MGKTRSVFSTDLLRDRNVFGQNPMCPPLPPRTLAVVDANVAINAALEKARHPERKTFVEQLVDAGLMSLVAPPKIVAEVERNGAQRWAGKADLGLCRDSAFAFLKRVALVEPGITESPNAKRMAARDPDDVPYALIYDELMADVVLSKDRDWAATEAPRSSGDATDHLFLSFLLAMRSQAHVRGSTVVTTIFGRMSWAAVKTPAFQAAVLALAATYLLVGTEKRAQIRAFFGGFWGAIAPHLLEFAQNSSEAQARLRQSAEQRLPLRPGLSLCDWLVRECVANDGLELAAIRDVLHSQGIKPIEPTQARAAIVRDRRLVLQHGKVRLRRVRQLEEIRR